MAHRPRREGSREGYPEPLPPARRAPCTQRPPTQRAGDVFRLPIMAVDHVHQLSLLVLARLRGVWEPRIEAAQSYPPHSPEQSRIPEPRPAPLNSATRTKAVPGLGPRVGIAQARTTTPPEFRDVSVVEVWSHPLCSTGGTTLTRRCTAALGACGGGPTGRGTLPSFTGAPI